MESFEEYARRVPPRGRPSEAWQRYIPLIPWAIGALILLGLIFDSSCLPTSRASGRLRFASTTQPPRRAAFLLLVTTSDEGRVEEHGPHALRPQSAGENAPEFTRHRDDGHSCSPATSTPRRSNGPCSGK